MPWSLFIIPTMLPAFALVLFRIGGMVMTAPLFSSPAIPIRIRAAVALSLSAMAFPVILDRMPATVSLSSVIGGGVAEIMTGIAIGLSLTIIMSMADLAGMTIAQQSGLALGEVFNPTYNDQSSVLGQLYSVAFVLVFLIAGGHRECVAAVLDSYQAMPVLTGASADSCLDLVVSSTTAAFVGAIRLASPVLIALVLTTVLLGILSRAMPQLHIMTVGFTFKVIITMAIAAITLAGAKDLLIGIVWDGAENIREVLGLRPVFCLGVR